VEFEVGNDAGPRTLRSRKTKRAIKYKTELSGDIATFFTGFRAERQMLPARSSPPGVPMLKPAVNGRGRTLPIRDARPGSVLPRAQPECQWYQLCVVRL